MKALNQIQLVVLVLSWGLIRALIALEPAFALAYFPALWAVLYLALCFFYVVEGVQVSCEMDPSQWIRVLNAVEVIVAAFALGLLPILDLLGTSFFALVWEEVPFLSRIFLLDLFLWISILLQLFSLWVLKDPAEEEKRKEEGEEEEKEEGEEKEKEEKEEEDGAFCSECGAKARPGARFCNNCGVSLKKEEK